MKNKKGFSLIELLIVVAIILIIAAIAIPNLLKSRIAANESSAVASERTIATSEITYFTSNNTYTDLPGMGPAGAALIDGALTNAAAGGTPKAGYLFTMALTASGAAPAGTNDQFLAQANASTQGTTGVRHFCTTDDAVLHYSATAAITSRANCQTADILGN